MSQWIPFEGTATDRSSSYRLAPSKDDGAVEFDKGPIRVNGGKVEVLVGANPTGQQPANMASSMAHNADCPHGHTVCVGLVHMCCGSGTVLGVYSGVWGC